MRTCTFFGHKDTPKEIEPILKSTLVNLIEKENVLKFYVGKQGSFDNMVKRCLMKLKQMYSIDYAVVLAYFPGKNFSSEGENFTEFILPEGIETVPPKFAISYRNKWMIEQSDYVVTYVKYIVGGAVQFKRLAEKKKKIVINLAE